MATHNPDVVVTLPDGWSKSDNPDGPLTYSPDDDSALQLSSPSWSSDLRGHDKATLTPLITNIVEGGRLGRVVAIGEREVPYGRMFEAEVESDEHGDVRAWLLVPTSHDVVLATWISGDTEYGDTARDIIDQLRPGLLSTVIGMVADRSAQWLAAGELMPHALLVGGGRLTSIQLSTLPHEIWIEACRAERANLDAEVVAQVLPATANGTDVAVIYAESRQRHRKLLVGPGGVTELESERVELFKPADPDIAAALAAASQGETLS